MTKKIIKIFLCSIFFIQAAVLTAGRNHCQEKKFELISSQGSNYNFLVTVKCSFNHDGSLLIKDLYNRYKDHYTSNDKIKVYSESPINQGFWDGVSLRLENDLSSDHGQMKAQGVSQILKEENGFSFKYSFQSDKIKAKGNAEYTKSIKEQLQVSLEADSIHLTFKNEVTVSKPWFAPEKIFISSVESGLTEDTSKMVDDHLSIIQP